jgi:signal transduction histidine kinase
VTSIRARLALALVAGLAIILGAGGFLSYETMRRALERREVDALRSKAWAIATAIGFEDGKLEVEPQEALAAEFSTAERPSYYVIHDGAGHVVARSPSWKDSRAVLVAAFDGREEACAVDLPDARHGIALELKATPDDELLEEAHGDAQSEALIASGLFVTVADDDIDLRTTLATLRATILAVFVASLAATVALVYSALRRGLLPLARMARDAQEIDVATLSRRFSSADLPTELAPIRDRLNDLLARLEQSFEREQRFNAAVAHELRTPIAELRTTAEVALRWPDAEDPARVLGDVLAIAERMQRLVSALLMLRRVESGQEALVRSPVVLREVVEAAMQRHAACARERALTVSCAIPHDLTLDSHAELADVIADNWIANAIEYAPRDSEVAIGASTDGPRFTLTVSNRAPELTTEDIEHLFEPFWRKDAARANGAHSGLGLTLTQTIARALDCEVRAVLDADATLRLELSGPMRRVSALK